MSNTKTKTDTKNKIFITGAKLFANDGYYKVSVREICDKAGVTKPVLYYYFKDKESLLFEMVEETHRLAAEIQKKHFSPNNDFKQNLRGIGKVYKEFLRLYPDFARFSAFVNIMAAPQKVKDLKYEYAMREFEKLSQFFVKGQQLGIIDSGIETDILVRNFIGSILTYISENILRNNDYQAFEKNVDKFIEFWIKQFIKSEEEKS